MKFWVGEKEKCFLISSSVIYDFESCSEMNIYTLAVTSLMQYKNVVMKCMFLLVIKEHSHYFKGVVMLQNCTGLMEDEPDCGIEGCVTCLDDGTEEGSIKVDESVDVKEEDPLELKFPRINTEPEVSLWGLCVRQQHFMHPTIFSATKVNIRKYILTIFMCVRCILYGLLFRPTTAQHIY
jgi:hypothetical protein